MIFKSAQEYLTHELSQWRSRLSLISRLFFISHNTSHSQMENFARQSSRVRESYISTQNLSLYSKVRAISS